MQSDTVCRLMRHAAIATLAVVGCATQPQPTRPATMTTTTRMIAVELPRKAHTSFSVVPAELGDPQIVQRIPHRVRMQRWGNLWIRQDAAVERSAGQQRPESVLLVLDESRTQIRVVIEDDDARYAVWVARDDAAPSIVAPIQLADRHGQAPAAAGVWLDPGAVVELGDRVDHRRELVLQDPAIRARGWVPNAIVGEVWTQASARPETASTTQLAPNVIIRAAPEVTSPEVATSLKAVEVTIVRALAAWTEIELARPYARVRGFVPSNTLGAEMEFSFGSAGRHAFGRSHTDFVDLPVGACLFDQAGGEVLGVNLAAKQRHARRPTVEHPGWWLVYINSPWSALALWAHDQSTDPKLPTWETCGTHAP